MAHNCPGCGKDGVSSTRLSCPRCWFRLPEQMRSEIWASYREQPHGERHRAAIQAALDWYAAN